MNKSIPGHLQAYILPFNWDVRLVWSLATPAQDIKRIDLDHLLMLPLWSSIPKSGMLFDISPIEVLENPHRSPHQFERVSQADTSYPIDLLEYNQSRWILDGVHRLAKIYQRRSEWIKVRVHPKEIIPEIRVD